MSDKDSFIDYDDPAPILGKMAAAVQAQGPFSSQILADSWRLTNENARLRSDNRLIKIALSELITETEVLMRGCGIPQSMIDRNKPLINAKTELDRSA